MKIWVQFPLLIIQLRITQQIFLFLQKIIDIRDVVNIFFELSYSKLENKISDVFPT